MVIHSMKESVTMLNTLDLGIKKVTIPLPFALDHVHCFLTAGENGWTMIDTGLHQDKTVAIWKEAIGEEPLERIILTHLDRKSTRLNSSHVSISYAVFCL